MTFWKALLTIVAILVAVIVLVEYAAALGRWVEHSQLNPRLEAYIGLSATLLLVFGGMGVLYWLEQRFL